MRYSERTAVTIDDPDRTNWNLRVEQERIYIYTHLFYPFSSTYSQSNSATTSCVPSPTLSSSFLSPIKQAPLSTTSCSGTTPSLNGTCNATLSFSPGYSVKWPMPLTSFATIKPCAPSLIHNSSSLNGNVTRARPDRRTKNLDASCYGFATY